MRAGKPHRFLAIGGGEDRDRLRRRVVESRIDLIIFAAMADLLACPQLADHADRLDQPLPALVPIGPLSGRGLLVQRLAGTDAEEDTARIEQTQRGKGLGDNRRAVAQDRTGDESPHPRAVRPRAKRRHRHPGLARMALIRLPGLEMVAAGQEIETGLLRRHPDLQQLRYGELLMREHVADHPVAQSAGFHARVGRSGSRSRGRRPPRLENVDGHGDLPFAPARTMRPTDCGSARSRRMAGCG